MPAAAKTTVHKTAKAKRDAPHVEGRCVCGAVVIEIDVPAFWAWHDHSKATRHAHGAAYATYIGCWKSKVRVIEGAALISHYEDKSASSSRHFCARCGTPLLYERAHSPRMVNIPRALFAARTGREPRYHIGLSEAADWEYRGEALAPLKGFPGVMWVRSKGKKRKKFDEDI
jgi:hypothetical protein